MPMGVASTYHARDPYPVYFTHGKGPHDLDGRRPGDPRLPQRLRLHGPGPRAPRHRRGHPEARAAGHAVRPADRRRHHHGRAPRRRVQAAPVALRELGFRGHHGRHPRRPRLHRPRADRQDVRLLPRPPRLRHGVDRREGLRRHRPARRLQVDLLRRRYPAELHRPHHPGAVQRRREHDASASSTRSPQGARRPPSSWSPP